MTEAQFNALSTDEKKRVAFAEASAQLLGFIMLATNVHQEKAKTMLASYIITANEFAGIGQADGAGDDK